MKIIAKVNFTSNIGSYIAGEEITGLTYQQVVNLNEKGFIEPLSYEELVRLKRELDKKEKVKEEIQWH